MRYGTLFLRYLYEGEESDAEGKRFKEYGYQGTQSDLYRLLNGLLIIWKIIPERLTCLGQHGAAMEILCSRILRPILNRSEIYSIR
ncbi:hypothetical protein PMSM_16145 [Paenibacillus macquariensis subsp. macquariensis]|nr:hypothetical protein PMSM_16145 [Paenibacillus macquariensis subsp. macquariensis]